ncbi:MAG: hypothetical protein AAFO94_14115 [Bacteroidota bacterium]
MRSTPLLLLLFLFFVNTAAAQFKTGEKGLTIMVTDGTSGGRHSQIQPKSDIPTSYDTFSTKSGAAGGLVFTDPIRELGMTDCIQAAAFLERPEYGKTGFMLIFSINDSIGGKQAEYTINGEVYRGVYRLIRQKISSEEIVPVGMTSYQIKGTFFLLGIS